MAPKKQTQLTDEELTLRLMGLIATNQFKTVQDKVQFLNKHGLQSNEISRALGISSGDASSYIVRKKSKKI